MCVLRLKIVFQLKMCFFEKSQKIQFLVVKNHVKSLPKNFAFFEISGKKKYEKKLNQQKNIKLFFFQKEQ